MASNPHGAPIFKPQISQNLWPSSGYELLEMDANGHLVVTDAYLRHLLSRPEIAPIAESCAHEIAIHDSLDKEPRRTVAAAELAGVQDKDAADNYAVWLRFRDKLLSKPTLEASYMALFQGEGVDVAPVLVQQLTQILLQHVLTTADEKINAMQARVAELLFRTQKISILEDGAVMAADDETVERHALSGGFGSIGELLKQGGLPVRSVDLDVLSADNLDAYWPRSEFFDMVISLNHGQASLDALCRVLELWIKHFLQVDVRIQTDKEIVDEHWVWHVGLDAQASGILNDLYTGAEVSEDRHRRLMCLFRLEFANPADMLAAVAGRPVYLAMAMDEKNQLKLKPQNLLLNLPLAQRS
ncbi:MAG: DUF6352 family protein [Burkholderiaceae bacterium]